MSAERAEKRTEATPARLREQLEQKMSEWRDVLRRQPTMARQIIKKLLTGPLRFTPRDGYYEFEGEGTFAKMLANVTHPIMVASLMPASWNRIASWLQEIEGLRRVA